MKRGKFILSFLIVSIMIFVSGCGSVVSLNGDLIEVGFSFKADDYLATGLWCALKISKEIPQNSKGFEIELSYGQENASKVTDGGKEKISIFVKNEKNRKKVLKTLSGKYFYSAKYECTVKNFYQHDQYLYTKAEFNHSELLTVPTSLIDSEEGFLDFTITAEERNNLVTIFYKKENNTIRFMKRGNV